MNNIMKPKLTKEIHPISPQIFSYAKSEKLQTFEVELKCLYNDLEASGISLKDLGFDKVGSPLNTLMVLRRHLHDIVLQIEHYESMLVGVHKIEINLLKVYLGK